MNTKTTNKRVVSRRCENLNRNQADCQMTKKYFVIRLLTILMIALAMPGINHSQQLPVNLGTAGNYAILAKSGISTVPPSAITGDIGVSPIDQTALTGFSLIMDPSGVFATSTQVVGKLYAADFASPTPSNLTTAVSNMETAYTDAAGRPNPDFNELGAGEIGGLTLVPGLYKWSTDVLITNDVTLNGNSNDVWIFQIAGGITLANGKNVNLTGGAQAANIFWQCAGIVSIGTTAHFEGIVLAQTSIELNTGATVDGLLLAQTAVTLDGNTVNQAVIPVELSSFTAIASGNEIMLHWTTATELNNLGFEVQRSNEDKEFSKVGFVEGNGTTTEQQNYNFSDGNLNTGKYYYRLKQVDYDGSFEYSSTVEVEINPSSFSLSQNHPNPFNPSTLIKYSIPASGFVSLKVFDVLGNEVAKLVNGEKPAGSHEVEFSGNYSSGIYFYQLQVGSLIETRKMMLVR